MPFSNHVLRNALLSLDLLNLRDIEKEGLISFFQKSVCCDADIVKCSC